jgi:hypothetical protein
MRIRALRTMRAQVVAGCAIVALSLAGGVASAHWVNRAMSSTSIAMWWETSVTALQDASQAMTQQAVQTADSAAPKRMCMTLDGKSFEWDFVNAPFAVLSCSQQ